jgi:hypothetical protein
MKPESLKELGMQILTKCLATLIAGLFLAFFPAPWVDDWGKALQKLPPRILLTILGTLTVICVTLCVWIDSLVSKKLLRKRHKPDPSFKGLFLNKETSAQICGICLEDGRATPVVVDGYGFMCSKCKTSFSEPPNPADRAGSGSSRSPFPRNLP